MPVNPKGVRVTVPASTANLGPGFDCLGMSLQIYNQVELRTSDKVGISIEVDGPAATDEVPTDDRNLVYRAASRVFGLVGQQPAGIQIKIHVNAPLARGLGSSASAIVGGMVAANTLLDKPISDKALLFEMARMEGHPDNIVAAFKGGLTASLMLEDMVVYERAIPADQLCCVLLMPGYELSTHKARAALPQKISHKDAVFNLCRVPLVFSRLASGNFEHLAELMDDRLHQPYRKDLVREFDVIIAEAEQAGAYAVCLSGAGPTLIALADKSKADAVAKAMKRTLEPIDSTCETLVTAPDIHGARTEILA